MNGPFVVAQAGSNANSGSAPVQVIKLIKPEAGKTEIFHASFNGEVKIDFTAIANEKITLFHDSKNQTLHIIFADGSQDIIEPFFDSRGTILSNLVLEMGPDVTYSGEQFAQTFTISEDPSVLPAAGPGGVASGADFLDAVVDPLPLGGPLPLLPPEGLPGITFTGTEAPAFTEEANLLPTVSGHVFGVVEEEQLNSSDEIGPTSAGQGNEDIHDVSGNDHDTTSNFNITTQIFNGTLAGLVSGGDLPITFLANSGANGTDVHDNNGNVVTSIGLAVQYKYVDSSDIQGWTSDGREIFSVHVNTDGTFTFTLNDQIDHPTHSNDDGTNPQGIFEETLNLDISNAIIAHDATPDQIVFPQNTIDIGVIDDTPTVSVEANENFSVTHDETLGLQSAPFGDDNDILFTPVFNGVSNPGHDPNGIFGLPLGYARSTGSALQIDNVSFGADGPSASNSQVYSLTLTDSGGHSTTGPVDSGIKTTEGNEIFLFVENGLIVGRYDGNDAGTDVTNTGTDPAAFAIAIDPANGQVSVVQYVSLFHGSPDVGVDSDEAVSLAGAAGSVEATLTVTDGDGDVASASANISGGVRFEDDGPTVHVIAKPTFSLTADESPGNQADDVTGPLTVFDNVTNKGDDPDEPGPTLAFATSSAGSLAILPIVSSFGVDGPSATNSVVYSLTLGGADGLASGLKVTDGNTISLYSETDGTHSWIVGRVDGGTFAGQAAFAIAIDPATGAVSIADYLSLFHPNPNNPNDTDTLNSHTILANVTLTDGDGDTASDSADISGKIHIRDDGPTVSVEANENFSVTHDETLGLQSAPFGDDNDILFTPVFNGVSNPGHDPDGIFGLPLGYARSTGSALQIDNVSFGADGPSASNSQVYSLTLTDSGGHSTTGPVDSGIKTTEGNEIFLFVENGLIVGRYDGNDAGTDVTNTGTDPAAFAIAIDPANGQVSVVQYVSLFHGSPDVGVDSDESVSLAGAAGSVEATLTVTDGDGDVASASANISGGVLFEDDGPTVHVIAKPTFSLTADESPGNQADDVTGPLTVFDNVTNKGDDPDEPGPTLAFATSSASSLAILPIVSSFGVDGPSATNSVVYSLTLGGADGLASGLKVTDGNTISLYSETDGTNSWIVGRVDGGTFAGQAAFAIAIDPATGAVSIADYLSLFHPNPNNPNDTDTLNSNTILANVTLTDGDGDTASDSADISDRIHFRDDGPSITSAFSSGTVIQDETPGVQSSPDPNAQNDVPSSGLPTGVLALFDAVTNKGVDPDVAVKDHDAIGFATSSSPIVHETVNFGADGPAVSNSIVLALAINGGNGADSGLQTTDGHEIFLFKEGSLIVGRYDGPDGGSDVTDTGTDPAAFAIAIGQDGNISVAQYVSLKNPIPGSTDAAHDEPTTGLKNVQVSVTATDGDGDHTTQTVDVSGNIVFQDDAPQPSVSATSGTLIIDETAGQDAGTNDVATTPALLALFAALPGSPIQIAQSGAPLFTTGSDFGADGPGAPPNSVFGLNVVNGTDSGLNATDGRSIYLYHEGNLIVGREGDVGTDAANAAGPVALAFSIDSGTGTLTLAEYTAIQHPNPLDPNEAGSPQTITNSALQVTFTLTDGDGDSSTASAGIGSLIQFRDDGPSITPPSNLIVNGSFEEGHTNLVGSDWDIYSSLPGWTYGADHIPFEVQTGGAGGIAAEDGLALIELDGDTFGNPAHQPPSATPDPFNTDATIQQVVSGTQAGVDYELTFWYTPRPGHSAGDDDGLNVLWNGNVIDSIDSSGMPEGVWQQITLFVTGTGPGDTLAFQGEGDRDEFGALIDNVSLIQAVVVDEDGLPNGNHDSQPGDIVVPNSDGDNNEATSTGYLNIKWGADNFDAAPDTHVGGNPALGFVQDSGGRSVTFTDATVGITGGTLTSHGDAIMLTLSPDHTVLTGTAQHGATVRTVFEVSLSDDNTGAFRFILQDALDHATGNNENNILLTFDFTATDSDGDPALGHFQVLVNDDMPVAVNDVDSVSGAGQFASGNVITGIDATGDSNTTDGNADHVGADGPGMITQVVGFGGAVNTVDQFHNFHVTGQFGTLLVSEKGDYFYTRTSASNGTDHFTYTLSDHDGDTSVANLDIFVSPVAHDDAVITNIAGSGAAIGIPDLALLLNDIDISGPSVLSVGTPNSGAIAHDAPTTTTTFTDDNLDGGSFNYTIQDNGTPSTAHVTVDRLQAGHSELDGTSANEILIGTTSGDTLVGNGGSDILVGNGGADHFLYNATTDGGTILNQLGADHILDFNTALGDSIDVSASAFGGGLVAGNDASGIFGSSANDTFGSPTERFHFNTSTHTLLYDSNGSLAGGTQVALAVLEHAATVDATHIHAVA